MAADLDKLTQRSASGFGPNIWSYLTADPPATVRGAAYWTGTDFSTKANVGDLFYSLEVADVDATPLVVDTASLMIVLVVDTSADTVDLSDATVLDVTNT